MQQQQVYPYCNVSTCEETTSSISEALVLHSLHDTVPKVSHEWQGGFIMARPVNPEDVPAAPHPTTQAAFYHLTVL